MNKVFQTLSLLVIGFTVVIQSGCTPAVPPEPSALNPPAPLPDNGGKYMCPYTQDQVLARWVDKAIHAEAASSVGGAVGATAGAYALRQVPLVGGILGNMAGKEIGRAAAVSAAGGQEFIHETSDQSFNDINDLAVWMYVHYSSAETYQASQKALRGIYPAFANASYRALFMDKYLKNPEP